MQVCDQYAPKRPHKVQEEQQPCISCGHMRVEHPGDEEYKAGYRDALRDAAGLLWQEVEKRIREVEGG